MFASMKIVIAAAGAASVALVREYFLNNLTKQFEIQNSFKI